ncbi:unnamed protein product [Rhizoctonia solani]|uniref:Uncharacterized protein n=1 Tax=Rhizoctonia solani TaxID=456999 RepID=A0A8H3B3V3_9AGAM|nr:unnamed protein product [Rhizoctonia solani]
MIYHCFIMVLLAIKSLSTPRYVYSKCSSSHNAGIGFKVIFQDCFHSCAQCDDPRWVCLLFTRLQVVFLAMLFNLLSWALAPATLAALPRWVVWSVCTIATSRLLLSLKGIQSAKQWDNANKIVRRDIEMQPRSQIEFVFAEHEDDECPNRASINGHLKTSTIGKYDEY